jgi:hypothetical protein
MCICQESEIHTMTNETTKNKPATPMSAPMIPPAMGPALLAAPELAVSERAVLEGTAEEGDKVGVVTT